MSMRMLGVICMIITGLVMGTVGLSPSVRAQEGGCPFVPRAARTIVYMNDGFLVSHRSEGEAMSSAYSATLAPGDYRVWLASYDDHDEKPTQFQPREQWLVQLRASTGTVVATSNAISDLPDDDNEINEVVNASLTVGQQVSSLVARHAAYPDPLINSIVPICAAFDYLPQVTPTPTPIATPTPSPATPTPSPSVAASVSPSPSLSSTPTPAPSPMVQATTTPIVLQVVTAATPTPSPATPVIPTEVAATGGTSAWLVGVAVIGLGLTIVPRRKRAV